MTKSKYKILIVDDVPENLHLLSRVIENWGYEVTAVDHGHDAIKLAEQHEFDAIILDIMMPDISGIELCRHIREELQIKLTPIIMLTGLDDNQTLAQCLEVGADDFIGKPFNSIVLRSRLLSAIRRKELEDEIIRTNMSLEDKVQERTAELSQTNDKLQREIELRRQKEQELIEFQEQLADMVVQKTQDLELSRDSALAAEKSMSAFLANMTHELRTPIHSILSFTRFGITNATLENPDLDAVVNNIKEAQDSGKNLLALIDNLLDLSKLKAGKMVYDFQSVDLYQLIERVIHEFSVLQEEKWVFIENNLEQLDLSIDIDSERISQVFRNLFSNALKFSPPGSKILLHGNYIDDGRLQIHIEDQGPGIPADELESIFDSFHQSSNTSSNAGGTGLGLTICKEIVESGHRGHLCATNNTQQGASFIVTLPRYQRLDGPRFWHSHST